MLNSDGSRIRYEGPKNYIANSTFENGSITGWSAAAVGSLPTGLGLPTGVSQAGNIYIFSVLSSVFMGPGDVYTNNGQTFTVLSVVTSTTSAFLSGTGAPLSSGTLTKSSGTGDATVAYSAFTSSVPSGNVTVSATSSSPLSGTSSLSYAWSAATTANNALVSSSFTIDIEDRAKVLTFKFYYQATSGTSNINWSGTSSNSFSVWVYDVQSNTWIQPAGVYGMTQGTGVGICTGTFQTSSTGTSFQIAIVNNAATAGAVTLYIDDISVSPQTAPIGAPQTDWVSYTPTFVGFGTVSNVSVQSRRNGPDLMVRGSITAGTSTATTASMTLGYNGANGNVVASSTTTQGIAGRAAQNAFAATFFGESVLVTANSGVVQFGIQNSTTAETAAANGSTLVGTGGIFEFFFSVPIQGWSSNVQMSNDTDTRVISFSGTQSSQAVTANVTNITFTTVLDRAGAWNGTQYVVPVSGDYVVSGNGTMTASATLFAYKNGVAIGSFSTAGTGVISSGAVLVTGCNAGDLLSLRSGVTTTIASGYLGIFRLSGPAVIAATESVNALYTGAPPTGTLTSAFNTATFATRVADSHNAYSSGTYTVPVSGKYSIASQTAQNGTYALNKQAITAIAINGTAKYKGLTQAGGVLTVCYSEVSVNSIPLIAGDLITIQCYNDSTAPSYVSDATLNWFSIARIGN